jgi:hypothetical protein
MGRPSRISSLSGDGKVDPRDVIQAQLEVLRQNLVRCRAAVENPGVDAKLRGRVAARFDKEVTHLEAEYKTLKGR